MKPLRVVLLTTDKRDHDRAYERCIPEFGTAPEALLQGFKILGGAKNSEIQKLGNGETGKESSGELRTTNHELKTPSEERRTTNYELQTVPPFEIHVISCTQQPLSAPEKLAPNIWYHSLHVPKWGWLRTGYLGCVRAVRKKLKEIQPDIVHGQGTERDCAISAVFSGYPNVLTIHGNMRAIAEFYRARIGSFHWFMAHLENLSLRITYGVFCNSTYTESLVLQCTSNVWRVPNAVRLSFFKELPSPLPVTVPIVMNIGVISAHKRQLDVLEIARILHEDGVEVHFQFVGQANSSDPYARRFLELVRIAEKKGYASYEGSMDSEGLIQHLYRASALVHFPLEEAFGLVVAESLARNLKFFGSRIGGVPDICSGMEGAELFAPDDTRGMIHAIRSWVQAGSPRPVTTAEVVKSRYHPEVVAGQHLAIYREVLSMKRGNKL
jgi:glycosyltransferase involved in cell wall biosynthesis